MKFFSTSIVVVAFILCISSCVKKENYPIIPHLTFNSIRVTSTDSLFIRVSFTDGDGDIGYLSSESNPQPNLYAQLCQDSSGHILPVVPFPDDTMNFTYNIPDITPTGSDKELSGIIQIGVNKATWQFTPISGQQVRFVIWIIDRAGHISNRVMTTDVTMP